MRKRQLPSLFITSKMGEEKELMLWIYQNVPFSVNSFSISFFEKCVTKMLNAFGENLIAQAVAPRVPEVRHEIDVIVIVGGAQSRLLCSVVLARDMSK